jgi:hypothetical protein
MRPEMISMKQQFLNMVPMKIDKAPYSAIDKRRGA